MASDNKTAKRLGTGWKYMDVTKNTTTTLQHTGLFSDGGD